MHVLILNQTFHPDVAATAQLMWDLARHLDARGHRVSAVTSRTVYGTDRQFDAAHERIGNIDIHRCAQTALGKRRLSRRVIDFASFYASAFVTLSRLPAPDVILALTSPPMIAVMGALQKQLRRTGIVHPVRLVYHVMDLYPDAALAMKVLHRGSWVARLMARLTRRTLDLSDAIIALGDDMKERLVREYHLAGRAPAGRIHVVHPWADGTALFPVPKDRTRLAAELNLRDTFTLTYSGNLGMAHDVDTFAGAIRRTAADADLAWLFIGGGKRFDQLQALAAAERWPHARFLAYRPREELGDSLNCADVHLVSQLPAFTGVVVPSKLFGIMAVGKPTIMVGPPDAECARIVAREGAGLVVSNGDVAGLVAAVRRLRDDAPLRARAGAAARAAFERDYDRPIACARIESILSSVVEQS